LKQTGEPHDQLLSLRAAADRLGVHPATLRRWADNGDILVMVTPGGHRRFPVSEIERVGAARQADGDGDELAAHLVELALERARAGIADEPDRRWLARLSEDERSRLREMGKRVMALLGQFVAGDTEEGDLIVEAESMGREYALNTGAIGMELPMVLQAIGYFRDNVIDALVSLPEVSSMNHQQRSRLARRVNVFLNKILISVAETFETRG